MGKNDDITRMEHCLFSIGQFNKRFSVNNEVKDYQVGVSGVSTFASVIVFDGGEEKPHGAENSALK